MKKNKNKGTPTPLLFWSLPPMQQAALVSVWEPQPIMISGSPDSLSEVRALHDRLRQLEKAAPQLVVWLDRPEEETRRLAALFRKESPDLELPLPTFLLPSKK